MARMKAAICPRYGPPEVFRFLDVEKPQPKPDQVRIKVHASAVTDSDIFIRSSKVSLRYMIPMRLMMGITRPRRAIIGEVLAGEVESVGQNIQRFKVGDPVYGITGFDLGAYAQYTCMKETDSTHGCLAKKPGNLGYEQATAAAYGGLLALQYMEKGDIRSGQQVLIYGASGTTGTIAVQFAKHLGAEVTAVCGPAHLQMVKELGADRAWDYTAMDTVEDAMRFDLVLDAVGPTKSSLLKTACKEALTPHGIYSSIGDGNLKPDSRRLEQLNGLIEAGHIKPVLDRIYPFEQLIEAHRYVEQGHKTGGVAITIGH